ncbi:MAG TPA: universal stress protein [Ktedonobacteraceae bacterium]|nr:universal stress protein [Ktedonobacteraceae bacterium]
MRILCCLDGTNVELVTRAIGTLLRTEERTIGVLYVTDSGPREEMEQQRERHLRPSRPPILRREQMQRVEGMAAREILEEGSRALGGAEMLQRAGRPEREIIQAAMEWLADVIVVCSRASASGGPPLGPKSVGHVARFVLDHSPCPVLLVRPPTNTAGRLSPQL